MSVQENIALITAAKIEINNHCMCGRFTEDSNTYTVLYPTGFFPNGARVSKGMGQAKALQRLLDVMERHYRENVDFS